MQRYSKLKKIEFVKRITKKNPKSKEGIFTMLVSEEVLKKDWDNKSDNRWDNI